MAARSEDFLDLSIPPEAAASLVEEALPRIGAVVTSKQMGVVNAHKDASVGSWGEDITVTLTPVAADKTRLHLISQSSFAATLIDYGINRQNILQLISNISTLEKYASPKQHDPHMANPPTTKSGSTPTQTPADTLRELKKMLDLGLITQDEYATKKAEILKKL